MSGTTLSLLTLFGSSFLASTLLPGGSEATLLYAQQQQWADNASLWAISTAGNTLGGLTNWLLGYWLRRKFPQRTLQKPSHLKALTRLQQYGAPILLLSWLPLVGDPLCLAAGWFGIRPAPAACYMGLGKGMRYALLLSLT